MRYALKFGYHGKNFSGYARQPNLRTIEGEIIKAVKKTNMIGDEKSANFQTASRTDKGVSACGNVLAFDTGFRKDEILPALNAHLEEIWFYGIAEVKSTFNPRNAKQRWYRYYLFDEGIGLKNMGEIAKIFLGTHDFSNFARIEEGKNPIRTLDVIDVSKENDLVILDFKAQGFLWHMVRRIVKAMILAAEGKLSNEEVKNALVNKQRADFGIAPPEPLILMDVRYDFDFNIDRMRLGALKTILEENLRVLLINSVIYDQMLRILED